ncbi:[NiFe]-hydrogenase assembly chaperone HybE [Rhodovulum sp. DZ06]|uniref:[NiFe]-hydrogenase assembly chaperone HybE n=1 Tax=Rhodovulum sp. DZ06 TaxID=3425126 RepID=UPI003D335D5C
MTGPRFEGSYLGDASKLPPDAAMECKICWNAYEPSLGDETRQIPPGAAFLALPEDWTCPECGAPKEQFMVKGGGAPMPEPTVDPVAEAVRALEAEFREIYNGRMRDTPLVNRSLSIEAIGFREWEGMLVGVLVTQWFMNIFLLPKPGTRWDGLRAGEKEVLAFPSGEYEFIHNSRDGIGGYKACSLFSPMNEFASHMKAAEVARAVAAQLFDPKLAEPEEDKGTPLSPPKAEPEAAAPSKLPDLRREPSPTRRGLLFGDPRGLGAAEGDAPEAPKGAAGPVGPEPAGAIPASAVPASSPGGAAE